MQAGKGWSFRRARSGLSARCWLGLLLWLAAGCASQKPHLDQQLLAEKGATHRNEGVVEQYRVACPDALDLTVDLRPELTGQRVIATDGCIALGPLGRLRVEGRTVAEVADRVAEEAELRPDRVRVRLADFKSQQIYLFGPGAGVQRTVAYQGPETVLDLLQRTGGIAPGAAPGEVYVVRPHVADGKPPEVFHIQLQAIVRSQDERTNLRLQPFDQLHIGETRRSSLVKCFPRWLQPTYESMCGLRRPGDDKVAR
jgi:protein involved in polysaccharide export with SLBB domain